MKIKTSEATGAVLDYLVVKARANGEINPNWFIGEHLALAYSTEWALGGLIIEREEININREGEWKATMIRPGHSYRQFGPTPLVAAMRCFVASKLGDEVEVPDELA